MVFFLSVSKIQAQETPTQRIVIEPTFQEIVLEEQTVATTSAITVTNTTSEEQQFEVFAVEVSQIDADGNVTFSDKPFGGEGIPFASYIDVSPKLITIPAQNKSDIVLTVKNDQNLGPGGHYAAVVIKGIPTAKQDSSKQTILPALSSFILARKKSGERYHISVTSVDESDQFLWWRFPQTLHILFENQGNVHTIPRGNAILKDVFGREVVEGTINEGSKLVLPRTQRNIQVDLRKIRAAFPAMLYTVELFGKTDPGSIEYRHSFFILVIDPFIFLYVALTIPLCVLIMIGGKKIVRFLWLRKRNKKL